MNEDLVLFLVIWSSACIFLILAGFIFRFRCWSTSANYYL